MRRLLGKIRVSNFLHRAALVILVVIVGAFIWLTNFLSDLDHPNFILRTNQSSLRTEASAGLPVKFETQDGLFGGAIAGIIIVLGAIALACTRKEKSIRGTEGDITKGMVVCGCLQCIRHFVGCPTRQSLSSYFTEEELLSLGDLSNHVKVVVAYWRVMPSNLHGTSDVVNGVPVAIINPLLSALDKRYVILHELMHHQLDELGCPSLCCTLQAKEIPADSWLRRVHFHTFVTRLVLHLWELIQHSRFNAMLKRAFKSGPESVRDSEYREYMSWCKSIPYYDMCGSDGHASVKRVAIAAHVATVILEGSLELRKEFLEFVRSRYPTSDDMVQLGEQLAACIRHCDIEPLKMTRAHLDDLFASMLADLQSILDALNTGLVVHVGVVQSLAGKFDGVSTFKVRKSIIG